MQTSRDNHGILRALVASAASMILIGQAKFTAQAASITFSPPANCAADTDVINGGGQKLAAFTWGGAAVVNGVSFQATAATINPGTYLNLAGFTTANATAFTTNVAPFNILSGSYSNLLRGAVFGPVGGSGTVTLSNLTVGHAYVVQLWASDPRATGTNRVEYASAGGGPAVTLDFNSATVAGGVGQFIYGTFTADAATQDIALDGTTPTAPDLGALQLNAIQLRDITGVWSGTTDGNWIDTDNASLNFSGTNFTYVKAVATNVYFGDIDAMGVGVANSAVTVGAGGVTGVNAIFNNNSAAYTLSSADATGITGGYGLTLNGTGSVMLNGANTYTGETWINSGTLVLGHASAVSGSSAIVLNGGVLDTTAAALSLVSGQTLRGAGTVRGSVNAGASSSIVLGTGTGNAGILTVTNNLTLDGQAFTFDLGMADSADKLNVGGVLTMTANSPIALNRLFPVQVNGVYTLITFASKSGTGVFTLASPDPNIVINNNANSVTLTVGGGLSGALGTWTNLAGGSWTNATNWAGFSIASGMDSIADFSTLNITADRTVTVNGNRTVGNLLFGDATQTHNWTLSTGTNTLVLSSGSPGIIVNSGQNATISAALCGAQGFTKFGAGTLTLSTTITNRFTNSTILVAGGTLNLNSVSCLGNIGNFSNSVINPSLIVSNATLSLSVAQAANVTYPNSLIFAGASNTINSAGTTPGFRSPTANSQVFSGGAVVTLNCVGQLPSLSGPMDGFSGTLIVNSSSSGTFGLSMGFNQEVGFAAPPYGVTGSSNAVFEFHGGPATHLYNGNGAATNYMGELRGGDNTVLFAKFNRAGAVTLEVGGLNTSSTFAGSIRNNRGATTFDTPTGLRKVGSGTLNLSGANLYNGPTEVRAGTLLVTGSLGLTFFGATPVTVQSGAAFELTGSIASPAVDVQSGGRMVLGASASLGSAAVTVNGVMDTTASGGGGFNLGGASLSGSGVVTGSVTLAGSFVNPGPVGTAGTLAITNGSFAATGGTLSFDLSNTPGSGNDLLDVNGNLDFSTPGVTVSLNKIVGSLGAGTYVIAKCSGSLSGSVGNLTLVGANPLDALQFNGTQLELVVSPATNLAWTGDGAGNLWDILTSTNWLEVATPSTFANGNAVAFDNGGGANPIVTIPVAVAPSIVTVSGSANYTFVGAGGISGIAPLLKGGTGTLTVLNTNSFVGNAIISGGTLAVGNAGTNGSLAANIATTTNIAALVFTTPLDQTVSNSISGPGSCTKLGVGALTLLADNMISGPTIISAGTLFVGDGVGATGSLGTGTVTNSATLALNRASSLTMSNAVRNNGGLVNLALGPVTLAGPLSGTGALTNDSTAGRLYLAASNTYSGGTFIKGGIVTLDNFNGLGTGLVTIDGSGAGALQFRPVSGSTETVANNITLPAATTQQFMIEGSLSSSTTVRLTGVISGGAGAGVTRFVDGWLTRAVISLENPANTFTGIPEVFRGRLAFTSDGALGNVANAINVNVHGSGNRNGAEPTLDGLRFDAGMTLNPLREIHLGGTENIDVQSFTGTIAGPVTGVGLIKLGTGTLNLNGPGSLTGSTLVSAGTLILNNNWTGTAVSVGAGATLGGTGAIDAQLQIGSGGTLSPGTSIGTLTLVTNDLWLFGASTCLMQINAASITCDKVADIGTLFYGGTLTVSNTAGTLAAGQTFPLFSAIDYVGDFAATNLPALNPGLKWQWSPASGSLTVVVSVATNPTNITASISGGNLNLSWPTDHLGWRLLLQTNALNVGLTPAAGSWFEVPGSAAITATNFPVDPANPTVFYRLVYP